MEIAKFVVSVLALVGAGFAILQSSRANKTAQKANITADTANNAANAANALSGAANELSRSANNLSSESNQHSQNANRLSEGANRISENALKLSQWAADTTKEESKTASLAVNLEKNSQHGYSPFLIVTNLGAAEARNVRIKLMQTGRADGEGHSLEYSLEFIGPKCIVREYFKGRKENQYIGVVTWEDDSKVARKTIRTTLSPESLFA